MSSSSLSSSDPSSADELVGGSGVARTTGAGAGGVGEDVLGVGSSSGSSSKRLEGDAAMMRVEVGRGGAGRRGGRRGGLRRDCAGGCSGCRSEVHAVELARVLLRGTAAVGEVRLPVDLLAPSSARFSPLTAKPRSGATGRASRWLIVPPRSSLRCAARPTRCRSSLPRRDSSWLCPPPLSPARAGSSPCRLPESGGRLAILGAHGELGGAVQGRPLLLLLLRAFRFRRLTTAAPSRIREGPLRRPTLSARVYPNTAREREWAIEHERQGAWLSVVRRPPGSQGDDPRS